MKLWRHVIINTKCSWLPGDRRGFRNRDHRIHSSGHYKAPPPEEEHAGLRVYHSRLAGESVILDPVLRVSVIRHFVEKMQSLGHRIIACSCGDEHVHALAELPRDLDEVKREVGKCKQKVSHAVRDSLPGSVWSAGGEYKQINDKDHFANAFDYIRTKQEPGTVVWSHRTDEDWIMDERVIPLMISLERLLIRMPCEKGSGSSGVPSDAGV